jgi:outer membrane protein TolC
MHALMMLLGTILILPRLLHAGAAPHDNRSLSLDDSIALALDRNLTIRQAERDVQTAASGRDQALAEFLPKFSALLDYIHKSEAPTVPFTTTTWPPSP